jgi:hypothetical protein
MLPSQFPEVQGREHLKRLLAEHVDMQFVDLRTMLRLPLPGLTGGCNFAAASFLFNVIAGSSVCFYKTSAAAFTAKGDRGTRFKGPLADFYPWQGEPVAKATTIDILYDAARNPPAHSLGLEAPPPAGHVAREIPLAKRSLSEAEITALEDEAVKPAWAGPTVTQGSAASGADSFKISIPALYWGVHRMLHALFADAAQAVDAEEVAKQFGPMWDKYVALGEVMTVSDASGVQAKVERAPETKS